MALHIDSTMQENPKNRCRICLEATNGKIELNQTIHYKETGILLRELLEYCVNEQVYENGKADGVCFDCMEKGTVYYGFKRLFKISQDVLLKEMEGNNGFSFEIKVEEDFEVESSAVKSENVAIKPEILEEEEMEQVKENPNECKMALQTDCNMLGNAKSRCRICLEATNGKIELNQTIHYKETGILLRELLEFCVNEQVYENGKADGLCLDCMEKGMVCYEFKKRFQVSQGILLKELEEYNSFSFEVKIEEDFEDGSFVVKTENTVINDETLEKEAIEDVSENLNKCDVCGKHYNSRSGMLRHKRRQHILKNPDQKETDKPTTETEPPPTTNSDKSTTESCEATPTFPGDKPASIPPTIPLGQKEGVELCEKTFKLRHKCTHTETAKSCNRCSYVSESSAALVEHMSDVHQQIVSKQFPCATCGKLFFKKRNLHFHMMIHAGIKKHTCEFCSLSFRLAGNLASHRRIHTGEKPYSCAECGRSFSQHASWKSHQLVHSKRKDHVCQKCGATFARARALTRHIQIHTTDRPSYNCTICTKAFSSRWGVKEHMLTHTGERDYECEFCGKRFNRNSILNVHRKLHTKETPHT